MRFVCVFAATVCAAAQQAPFSIDQVLSASFPSELTAAPSGGKVAWYPPPKACKIMVAVPPALSGRKVTAYTEDDGQELLNLIGHRTRGAGVRARWSANGSGEIQSFAEPDGGKRGCMDGGARWIRAAQDRRGQFAGSLTKGRSSRVRAAGSTLDRAAGWKVRRGATAQDPRRMPAPGMVSRRRANRVYQRARRPRLHRGVRRGG